MMINDMYQTYIRAFCSKHNIDLDNFDGQSEVAIEELKELKKELESGKPQSIDDLNNLADELADVVFVSFMMAEINNINLRDEFERKANHNLQKSTERDENGKVTDDA